MEKWLLDFGDRYLNKTNFGLACKVMFAIQGCLVFVLFRAMRVGGIIGSLSDLIWGLSMSGQLLQLGQEVCLAVLFLGLMKVAYRKGYQKPLIGYLLLLTFCAGVLTFVVNNTGGVRGMLFFLSSIVVSVLQIVVGFQLQKTELAKLGKFILAFPVVMCLSIMLFGASPAVMVIAVINVTVLTWAFYTVLSPNL